MSSIKFDIPAPPSAGTPGSKLFPDYSVDAGEKAQFTITPWNEMWLGASREDIDLGGWKTKGCFFGGGPNNLSNGGALLIQAWAPEGSSNHPAHPAEAMRMIIDRTTSNKTKIFYEALTGGTWVSLGMAFDVPADFLTTGEASKSWAPCLRWGKDQADSQITIDFEKGDQIQGRAERHSEKEKDPKFPYEGTWTLTSLNVGPELGSMPLRGDPMVDIYRDGSVKFNIGNGVHANIGGAENYAANVKEGFADITVTDVREGMTRMGVMGPAKAIIDALIANLPSVNRIHVDGDSLILQDHTRGIFECTMKPYHYKTYEGEN